MDRRMLFSFCRISSLKRASWLRQVGLMLSLGLVSLMMYACGPPEITKRAAGDFCVTGEQCRSGLCETNEVGVGQCVTSASMEVGKGPCTDGTQCKGGVCIKGRDPLKSYCSKECESNDCPEKYHCAPYAPGLVSEKKVCFQVGDGKKPLGETCWERDECQSAVCLGVFRGLNGGWCTQVCNKDKCPDGFSCFASSPETKICLDAQLVGAEKNYPPRAMLGHWSTTINRTLDIYNEATGEWRIPTVFIQQRRGDPPVEEAADTEAYSFYLGGKFVHARFVKAEDNDCEGPGGTFLFEKGTVRVVDFAITLQVSKTLRHRISPCKNEALNVSENISFAGRWNIDRSTRNVTMSLDDGKGNIRIFRELRCQGQGCNLCKQTLECTQEGKCQDGLEGCEILTDADCKGSNACKKEGRCVKGTEFIGDVIPQVVCEAGNETDCKASEGCVNNGHCSKVRTRINNIWKNVCAVATNVDCEASKACKDEKRCGAQNNACVLCNQSERCRREGACTWSEGRCVIKSFSDCSTSTDCTEKGRCALLNGQCVPCNQGADCAEKGLCSQNPLNNSVQACIAGTNAECKTSRVCRLEGKCSALRGVCVANTNPECQNSEECKLLGYCTACTLDSQCTARVFFCVAGTSDCPQSQACQSKGECGLSADLKCVTCDKSIACRDEGKCYLGIDGISCVAKAQTDCEKSTRCKQEGRCQLRKDLNGDGECVVVSDNQCLNSEKCIKEGFCQLSVKDGRCVVGEDSDCAKSTVACLIERRCVKQKLGEGCIPRPIQCASSILCKREGLCIGDETRFENCKATDVSYCEASTNCKDQGRCSLGPKDTCIVSGDKDCNHPNNRLCKKEGRCTGDTVRGLCIATSDAQCQTSDLCKNEGKCALNNQQCTYCYLSKQCREEGRCNAQGTTCIVVYNLDCKRSEACTKDGRCILSKGQCVAGSHEDCQRSEACTKEGRCFWMGTRCVATSVLDCRRSENCKTDGLCSISVNQECVLQTDDDCAGTTRCQETGACHLIEVKQGSQTVKVCGQKTTASCTQSSKCSELGNCTWIPSKGSCLPGSAKDCENSQRCKTLGRCTYVASSHSCSLQNTLDCQSKGGLCSREGKCAVVNTPEGNKCQPSTNQDCQDSDACKEDGLCERLIINNSDVRCGTLTNDNCAKSANCKLLGHCGAVLTGTRYALCGPRGKADCENSTACLDQGLCNFSEGTCKADLVGCRNSQVCKREGRCGFDPQSGQCVSDTHANCERSEECLNDGKCTREGASCIRLSNADCLRSKACKASGHCTLVRVNNVPVCGPATDADCRRSDLCKTEGRCRFLAPEIEGVGSCVAGSDVDCQNSSICLQKGQCAYSSKTLRCSECNRSDSCVQVGRCTLRGKLCLPTQPDHCSQSTVCKEQGLCSLSNQKCIPLTDNDCKKPRSEACAKYGRCAKFGDVCLPLADEDCAKCDACFKLGACKRTIVNNAQGRQVLCAPATDQHCGESSACTGKDKRTGQLDATGGQGFCKRFGLKCQPGSQTDCNSSRSCVEEGKCVLFTNSDQTTYCAPFNNQDCEDSKLCKEQAACSLAEDGTCQLRSQLDCQRSDLCKKEGKCRIRVDLRTRKVQCVQ